MKTEYLFQKIRSNWLLLLAWFCLVLGLLITSATSLNLYKQIHQDEQQEFDLRCQEIKAKIENRLAKHKLMLLGGAAMFEASETVTRDEWHTYVKTLGLSQELDGVQGLGFSLWIKPEQLKAHEIQMQKEGFVNYYVKPEGKRDMYTSIIYLEPFEGRNLRAFGYDMYSESVRRIAMDLTMETGNVSLSGKVKLVQETTEDVQAGTLMYAPVYQKNTHLATVTEKREALFGWVYSPFRMRDLLNNIVLNANQNNLTDLEVYVYDGINKTNENLLYQSSANFLNLTPLFHSVMQLELLNTVWTLEFNQFSSRRNHFLIYANVWLTLISGSFISSLLFFLLRSYFFTLEHAHSIAEKLINTMQENEKKLAIANADLLQFASISTHHLQEPSRRIVSFARRLLETLRLKFLLDGEIETILKFIEQSALRQRALIRDIQLYLAASTPRAAIEMVNVNQLIYKVLKHHSTLIKQKKIQIEMSDLPEVKMDRPRLFDVFNCLLENSFLYTSVDRVPLIRIYGELEHDIVRYYLSDNGIGIAQEYHERVFQVFERLQIQDDQDSTGIGLAIVRRIIESMNGNIYLNNTTGGGLTVIFELPAR